jgi:hypothetical protein
MGKREWTASRLAGALERKYPYDKGYALFFDVADASGGDARRRADAVMVGLWKTRGFHFTGFEIKAGRGDWLRELRTPGKADRVASFCRYWYIVAAPGVVDAARDPLPPTWGVLVPGGDGGLAVEVPARPFDACDPSPAFVASLCRAAYKRASSADYVRKDEVEAAAEDIASRQIRIARLKCDRELYAERSLSGKYQHVAARALAMAGHVRDVLPDPADAAAAGEFVEAVRFIAGVRGAQSIKRLRQALRLCRDGLDEVSALLDGGKLGAEGGDGG